MNRRTLRTLDSAILGVGAITPLGCNVSDTEAAMQSGAVGALTEVQSPRGSRRPAMMVPPTFYQALGRQPRLRRSSTISYLAAAAAQEAMQSAQAVPGDDLAVVLGVTDGSVIYTRRFFDQVVKEGAGAASPLLFPETVYNAPASHVAAALQCGHASYTLTGDASVGLGALHFGAQLLHMGIADRCLVVCAEEVDWILCEAYAAWGGTLPIAECASAVLLGRSGAGDVHLTTHPGESFATRRDAPNALARVLRDLSQSEGRNPAALPPQRIYSCANGTFIDQIESDALQMVESAPDPIRIKPRFGESLAAGALLQVVLAHQYVRAGGRGTASALSTTIGYNHQVNSALVW